jgi:aspartate aminotransferase
LPISEKAYIRSVTNTYCLTNSVDMSNTTAAPTTDLKVSRMAENLIGSEIIKLAGEIRELIARGEKIYNFTIGDFDPAIFPIPAGLKDEIIRAYHENETNYPAADGMAELRKVVSGLIQHWQGLSYAENEILIAGGARPVIYAIFQAIVDPGDTVVFPVPSWNNNHYTHLAHARQIFVETGPENNFMPVADDLRSHLPNAALLALCSPLNPTGTVFGKEQLEEICDLVLAENKRRGPDEKPLYLMYDQIYWLLTYGSTEHFDPVSLRPEIRPYTIYVDGISKSLAATGVRVGWAFGPRKVIDKMKSILGHVGAWSPKAEQVASGRYLKKDQEVNQYLNDFKKEIENRLQGFYRGIVELRNQGLPVDAISPMAAIYLTVKFDLKGMTKPDGELIETTEQVTAYLLNEAKLAVVPFSAFGASKTSVWYRLSVGTASRNDVGESINSLKSALLKLSR